MITRNVWVAPHVMSSTVWPGLPSLAFAGLTAACMAQPAHADCIAPGSGLDAVGEVRAIALLRHHIRTSELLLSMQR